MIHSLFPKLHRGSTVIIVLLFTLLLLIGLTGSTYMLSKTIRSTSYITDTIQANYAADSALEVRLYELKLRREGYEPKPTASSDLQVELLKNTSTGQSTIQNKGRSTSLTLSKTLGLSKTVALFEDDATSTEIPVWLPQNLTLSCTSVGCNNDNIELKFSGKTINTSLAFETLTVRPKTPTGSSLNILNLIGYARSDIDSGLGINITGSLEEKVSDFLASHREVYFTIRNTDRDAEYAFTLQSNINYARYDRTIEAMGAYRDVLVKKVLTSTQDQLPELFSVVLSN